MSIIRRMLYTCLSVIALATFLFAAPAVAAPIVYIDPASTTVAMGGLDFTVNIMISGLTEPIGGFSTVLTWNSSLLTGSSYVPDPDDVMAVANDSFNDGSLGFGAGSLDLYFIADPTIYPTGAAGQAALAASEGTGFKLASVTFAPSAVNSGITPLTLTNVVLSDYEGTGIQEFASVNGSVCVETPGAVGCGAAPIPEPASILLIGTGFAGLALLLRKRTRN